MHFFVVSSSLRFLCYGWLKIRIILIGSWPSFIRVIGYSFQPFPSLMTYDISGVKCNNCYAFFGAGFLAVFEYRGSSVSAEVKVGGGAGYNVDILMNNPFISGTSSNPNVISGGPSLSIPIGSSFLSLNIALGGIGAVISGTGSATGSAETGAGWSVTASAGVMYAGGSLSVSGALRGTARRWRTSYMPYSLTVVGTSKYFTVCVRAHAVYSCSSMRAV